MQRDLTTLARNHAVSDAVIVSAEEDLAEVVAEVQDFGMRVTIIHIMADGDWTISRPFRQECDDIVEISAAHLRPFVDLIPGAEPADHDGPVPEWQLPAPASANGNGSGLGAMTHQGLPGGRASPAPTIYTGPGGRGLPAHGRARTDAPAPRRPPRCPRAAAAGRRPSAARPPARRAQLRRRPAPAQPGAPGAAKRPLALGRPAAPNAARRARSRPACLRSADRGSRRLGRSLGRVHRPHGPGPCRWPADRHRPGYGAGPADPCPAHAGSACDAGPADRPARVMHGAADRPAAR